MKEQLFETLPRSVQSAYRSVGDGTPFATDLGLFVKQPSGNDEMLVSCRMLDQHAFFAKSEPVEPEPEPVVELAVKLVEEVADVAEAPAPKRGRKPKAVQAD